MELPDTLSDPLVDEKTCVQEVENVLKQHQGIAGQRNGADDEDPDGLGPVCSEWNSSLLNDPWIVNQVTY